VQQERERWTAPSGKIFSAGGVDVGVSFVSAGVVFKGRGIGNLFGGIFSAGRFLQK